MTIPGCLAFLFIFLPAINSQPLDSHNDLFPDSLARQQYRSYLKAKDQGDYRKAWEYLNKYALITDSIVKKHRTKQLEEIKARSEEDFNQHKVDFLIQDNRLKELQIKKNKVWMHGVASLAVLILLVVLLAIRQGWLKASRRGLAVEQNLLRSQMNPHFIFNTLTNIQSFIVRKDDKLSLKYLDYFSELISTIFEYSGKKAITLETELNILNNYFKLQQLRFGEKLSFVIHVWPGLDPHNVMLPPMVIQPLIENAIEHGIKPKDGNGRIDVRFMKKDAGLVIEVEDNGVGRQHDNIQGIGEGTSRAGLALTILRERIESMNKGRSGKNKLEIKDLVDDENRPAGTLVRLVIFH